MFRAKFSGDATYFTGCMHLQHKNITRGESSWSDLSGTRNFKTTEEMTDIVMGSFADLEFNDTLFILGDVIFGKKSNLDYYLDRIPAGNIIYIYGNHDEWMRKEYTHHKLAFIGDYLEVYVDYKLVCMSHYPAAVWNESHKGSYYLHSHSHGTYYPGLPTTLDQGKILDVGWDVWGRPVGFNGVKKVMEQKHSVFKDHHNKATNR